MNTPPVACSAVSSFSMRALVLSALVLVSASVCLRAQTAGNPIVYGSGPAPTGTVATSAYIDAYAATGGAGCSSVYVSNCSDICERINYAWAQALGPAGNNIFSATNDARGFPMNGTWTCSVSPFTPSSGKTSVSGILLLGGVNISTSVTWYVPSQTELRGLGSGGISTSSSPYNTIITNAGISGPVIQMGPSTAGVVFGVVVDNLTIDCKGAVYSNCTGIFNNEAEERSEVHDVQIWDASLYGLHVSAYIAGNAFPAAANSGPYRKINVAYNACTGCSAAIGLVVDGAGSTLGGTQEFEKVIRQFDDITISGDGVTGNINTGAIIYGASTALTNSHIEFVNTGIQIGTSSTSCFSSAGNCETHGVTISNVSIAPTNSSGHNSIVVGNAKNAAPLTGDVTLIGIAAESGAASSLVDNVSNGSGSSIVLNGGLTPTAPWDPYIGFYAIGHCSTDTAGCTPSPTVKSTQ